LSVTNTTGDVSNISKTTYTWYEVSMSAAYDFSTTDVGTQFWIVIDSTLKSDTDTVLWATNTGEAYTNGFSLYKMITPAQFLNTVTGANTDFNFKLCTSSQTI
jgi:hypothetical protein